MRFSIILPTYNRSGLLKEALASIFVQQGCDIEVVVVDDGSTDDTEQVFRRAREEAEKSRISMLYMPLGSNRGAPAARNAGFGKSSGDVILFMDSDDVLEAGILYEIARAFEDNECDYVYGRVRIGDKDLHTLPGRHVGGRFSAAEDDYVAGYHWHTMGAAYRRHVVDCVGPWNEMLTGSQDWEFQARIKLSGCEGRFLDLYFGTWRQHKGPKVGANTFRLDYVKSVGMACGLVAAAAGRSGRLGERLKCSLFRKLVVHAVELGANGHASLRHEFFSQALDLRPSSKLYGIVGWMLQIMPPLADGLILLLARSAAKRRRMFTR